MPGKEIKGRSARANYRHGGRTGFKHGTPGKEKVVVDPSKKKRSFKGSPKHRALTEDISKQAKGGKV